jgi:hypothetical protein
MAGSVVTAHLDLDQPGAELDRDGLRADGDTQPPPT